MKFDCAVNRAASACMQKRRRESEDLEELTKLQLPFMGRINDKTKRNVVTVCFGKSPFSKPIRKRPELHPESGGEAGRHLLRSRVKEVQMCGKHKTDKTLTLRPTLPRPIPSREAPKTNDMPQPELKDGGYNCDAIPCSRHWCQQECPEFLGTKVRFHLRFAEIHGQMIQSMSQEPREHPNSAPVNLLLVEQDTERKLSEVKQSHQDEEEWP